MQSPVMKHSETMQHAEALISTHLYDCVTERIRPKVFADDFCVKNVLETEEQVIVQKNIDFAKEFAGECYLPQNEQTEENVNIQQNMFTVDNAEYTSHSLKNVEKIMPCNQVICFKNNVHDATYETPSSCDVKEYSKVGEGSDTTVHSLQPEPIRNEIIQNFSTISSADISKSDRGVDNLSIDLCDNIVNLQYSRNSKHLQNPSRLVTDAKLPTKRSCHANLQHIFSNGKIKLTDTTVKHVPSDYEIHSYLYHDVSHITTSNNGESDEQLTPCICMKTKSSNVFDCGRQTDSVCHSVQKLISDMLLYVDEAIQIKDKPKSINVAENGEYRYNSLIPKSVDKNERCIEEFHFPHTSHISVPETQINDASLSSHQYFKNSEFNENLIPLINMTSNKGESKMLNDSRLYSGLQSVVATGIPPEKENSTKLLDNKKTVLKMNNQSLIPNTEIDSIIDNINANTNNSTAQTEVFKLSLRKRSTEEMTSNERTLQQSRKKRKIKLLSPDRNSISITNKNSQRYDIAKNREDNHQLTDHIEQSSIAIEKNNSKQIDESVKLVKDIKDNHMHTISFDNCTESKNELNKLLENINSILVSQKLMANETARLELQTINQTPIIINFVINAVPNSCTCHTCGNPMSQTTAPEKDGQLNSCQGNDSTKKQKNRLNKKLKTCSKGILEITGHSSPILNHNHDSEPHIPLSADKPGTKNEMNAAVKPCLPVSSSVLLETGSLEQFSARSVTLTQETHDTTDASKIFSHMDSCKNIQDQSPKGTITSVENVSKTIQPVYRDPQKLFQLDLASDSFPRRTGQQNLRTMPTSCTTYACENPISQTKSQEKDGQLSSSQGNYSTKKQKNRSSKKLEKCLKGILEITGDSSPIRNHNHDSESHFPLSSNKSGTEKETNVTVKPRLPVSSSLLLGTRSLVQFSARSVILTQETHDTADTSLIFSDISSCKNIQDQNPKETTTSFENVSKTNQPHRDPQKSFPPDLASDIFPRRNGQQNPRTKSLQASVGKRFIETEYLPDLILDWNVAWLQIQKGTKKHPLICENYFNLKDFYKNIVDYYNTYLPLHMLSIWFKMHQRWKTCGLKYICRVEDIVDKYDSVMIRCFTEMKEKSNMINRPKKEDILLCTFTRNNGIKEKLFGRICSDFSLCKNSSTTKNHKKIRFKFLCAESLDAKINDTIEVQILCNIRTALMQNEALLSLDPEMKDLILNPVIHASQINAVRVPSNLCFKDEVKNVIEACTKSGIRGTLVDIASASYDDVTLVVSMANFFYKNNISVLICVKRKSPFFKLISSFNKSSLILGVRSTDVKLSEEYKKLTFEERIKAEGCEILKKCHITLTMFSAFSLGDDREIFHSQNSLCIIHEAHLCTEAETALPLYYFVKHLILVGRKCDINIPKTLKHYNYHKSLFSRFYDALCSE